MSPAGGDRDPPRGAGATAGSRLADLLVRSRPRFWLYLAGPALVGVVYAAETAGDLLAPLPAAVLAYFLLPANVLLYGVNDVFDAEVDAYNPRKAGGRERRYRGDRLLVAAAVVSGLAGLALVPFLPALAVAAMVGFLALAVAYSAPPLRLKTTPPLDSVSNGLYVLPGVVGYVAIAGSAPPAAALAGGWLWTMAMHAFSAVPDLEPDRRAGVRTTATALGKRGAYAYCGACWLASAAAFFALDPRAGALLAVYPVLLAGIALSRVDVARAYRWYPPVNAAVGAVLTLGGLRVLAHG